MSDLIDRQAAIDALQKEIDEGIPPFNDAGIRCGVRFASSIIENLPRSAQPEKSTTAEKSQLREEKSTRKLIYLDDAIEEVELAFKSVGAEKAEKWILENLNNLPSAQPDLLDDGTLMITVPRGMLGDVKRVLVDEVGTKFCKVMYQDEPERRWIPVSERLPEDYTDVLVWFEYFRYGDYNRLYQTYGIGDYIANYGWMINHETGWHKLRVIAWQPLPSPYTQE